MHTEIARFIGTVGTLLAGGAVLGVLTARALRQEQAVADDVVAEAVEAAEREGYARGYVDGVERSMPAPPSHPRPWLRSVR